MCISNDNPDFFVQQKFSTKNVKEALFINFYFGMLFGILIGKYERFDYAGFYFDRSIIKCILRFFVYLVFVGVGLVVIRFVTIKY